MKGVEESRRFPEIDVLRGLAVSAMVVYHLLFDLTLAGITELNIYNPILKGLADVTAATFFVIVGVSMYVSFYRVRRGGKSRKARFWKYVTRGFKLFGLGLIISAVSYVIFPEYLIVFGALHFIGISVILAYFALELTVGIDPLRRILALLIFSAATILLAIPLRTVEIGQPFLIWLGLIPEGFQSLDFFPLLPWFGFATFGLVLGELLYPKGRRRYNFYELGNKPVQFLGRNSLLIYFLHQPAIYFGIALFVLIAGGDGIAGIFNF